MRGPRQAILGPGNIVVPVADVDYLVWARWYEGARDKRVVGSTEVGPLHVSTVFLGLDHGGGKRQLWFETMVFGDRDHLVELPGTGRKYMLRTTLDYQRRYETWAEAEVGHREACVWAKEHLDKLTAQLGLLSN